MALKYPDRIESNNPQAYGIVKATEVSGAKNAAEYGGLLSIPDNILSANGDGSDALYLLWIDDNSVYRLVDWNNRHDSKGWRVEYNYIEWGSNNHLNSFTESGQYYLTGQSNGLNGGLPILNSNPGHTFDAVLRVLDSSLTKDADLKLLCITLILSLSNRMGGDGHIFVRTIQTLEKDNLTRTDIESPACNKWSSWEKLLGIIEKNTIKHISDLDTYTTNGMYSGLFANTTFQTLGGLKFTPGDTFLLITVNGYAASAFGTPQLTQMLYKLPSKIGSGNSSARMYLRTAYWDKNADPKAWVWANWDRLATASEISGGGGGSIEEYNTLIELIAANTEKISSVESTANDAKSAAETAQTDANAAQTTAASANNTASEAKATADTIKIIRPDLLSSFNLIDPNRLIIGKYITTNGSITQNPELFMSEFIDMLGITQVYGSFHGVGIALYAYSEDFSFISKVNVTPPMTYTLPENTRYIRISGGVKYTKNLFLYTEENSKYYAYGITKGTIHSDNNDAVINGKIDDLRKEVRTIKTSNQYINKINYLTDWIDGYIIVNGNMVANNNGCATNFIDVIGLDVIYSNAAYNGNWCGYDENKNYVKTFPINNGIYRIEEGIRYIRLSFNNKNNKASVFLYTNADYVNLSKVQYSNIYTYGITYSDVEQSKLLEPIPEKLDKFHTAYINSLNQFTTDIVEKENAIINSTGQIIKNPNTVGKFYSKYIPVVGGKIISSNIQTNGGIFAYDKNKEFLGKITGWKHDNTVFENYIQTNIVPDNCAFIRVSGLMSGYSNHVLYVGNEVVYKKYDFGETFDSHFKYRNKKLVTIGDSITYQTSWQRRLCDLTGMRWNRKEVRGADESVKTEGYGYILLDSSLGDTDTYYESVDGITKTEETIVDGFGYAHPIWIDTEGNKYRQPCRMAEGGETVMPVRTTSIYSRASDSKYYKGDVIIVFAGANDKVGYINKYPTYGDLSTIQGVTNLKTDSEDTTEATFEIYTDDRILEVVGDYSDVNDVTGTKKYNYTFRACFRGLLKKVVDANPEAQIIVIGPFATMIKGNEYISRSYDYLTKVENEVIAECAREFSCQYIDLMPLFGRYNADRYFLGYDGTVYVHPIKAGGNKIAEYIASMM